MKNKTKWTRVTPCESIPAREGRLVKLGGRDIAIFNLGDRFVAINNECPHQGGPLCDGIVSGTTVVCPLHGWKIDLGSGLVKRPEDTPGCVETFPVRVEAGIVMLEVPTPATSTVNSSAGAHRRHAFE